jgi:hypothetical protein
VYQVKTSLEVRSRLAERPGLFARAKETLLGALETAIEIRMMQGGYFPAGSPMTVQLDDYLIRYELDLDARNVLVLSVERVPVRKAVALAPLCSPTPRAKAS